MERAVRPIDILTDSYFCIVLRVRGSNPVKPRGREKRTRNKQAKANFISNSSFLIPYCKREALAPHLENCTGKTFREKLKSRKIPVRSDGSGTHKSSGYFLISIVLGMRK